MQIQGISKDKEASIYQQTFLAKRTDLPQAKVIPMRPHIQKSRSSGFNQPQIVCFRCGGAGHISSNCVAPLPSVEEIEAELNQDIDDVIAELAATGNYDKDEFGYYSKEGVSPIKVKGSWKTTKFCVNCAEAGHSADKCPKISFPALVEKMGDCITGKGRSYDPAQVEELFYDIWD